MIQRRIILPALFALLFVVLIAAYGAVFLILPIPQIFKLIIAVAVGAIAAAMAYVVIRRNREIREEGKDDLSKY